MSDKRRMKISVFPYILLILALFTLLIGVLIFINYSSQTKIITGVFIAGAVLMVLAFILRPAMLKELLVSRRTLLWANDFVLITVVILIGAILAHIGFRHNIQYDFTKNQMNSLSELTFKNLRELKKDVLITCFYPKGTIYEQMLTDLLKEYRRHSEHLKYVFVDPNREPVKVKSMNIKTAFTIVVQCESNRRDLFLQDIFFLPDPRMQPNEKPRFIGEQSLTTAIVNVLKGAKRVVTFVKGHNEASISGFKARDIAGLSELLNLENLEVNEVSLLEGDISPQTSVLAIVSPQQDYSEAEIKKINAYLTAQNGHLLAAIDPGSSFKNLEELIFNHFGVSINNDAVVDAQGISLGSPWIVIPGFAQHPITAPILAKKQPAQLFYCRTLSTEQKKGVSITPLLKTISHSWAKNNSSGVINNTDFEENKDMRGPLTIGVTAEKTSVASGSRAIIFGESDFFSNGLIAAFANRDLISNAINWLAGQEEMLSIRPKLLEYPTLQITENDTSKIFTFCVVGVPIAVVLFGCIVFIVRRRVK